MTYQSATKRKIDALAEWFLDEHWPESWDEGTGEWDLVLPRWQEEMEAAIYDRWHEVKKEVNEQKAEAYHRKLFGNAPKIVNWRE